MNTNHATDTKNWGSIWFFPVMINTIPFIVCKAITVQWKLNILTRSDMNTWPIAGKIENIINSQSWNIIKCRALTFHISSPIHIAKDPKLKKRKVSTRIK